MTSITSAGVGSGLNIEGLITQLMAAERQPETQMQTQQQSYQSKLSALGTVKSALSSFQTAADALKTTDKFSVFKAAVGDSSVLSASAGIGAVAGNYQIEVSSLAQNQKLVSAGYSSASATIPTGTLTIDLGKFDGTTYTADSSRTVNITIDSTNNTLTGLRNAINASGAGVTASIIDDGSANPARLVISSKDTGTANTMRLSGLSGFDFNPTAASSLEQKTPATDAVFTVDDIPITKSSNTITDAIQGVTLNLSKTNVGSPTTLTVSEDTDTLKSKVQAFVKAYNDVTGAIKKVTAYDATTKTAAALNGDSTVRNVATQLRSILGNSLSAASGGFSRLSDAGISFQKDGTLAIDDTKLSSALTDPNKDISGLFATSGGVTGFAAQISTTISGYLDVGGLITARSDGLNKTIQTFNDRISAFEDRMTLVEARYRKQFTALDSTIASMNSTSTYLTQQLAKL